MSGYTMLALFALFILLMKYATIADAYDEQRWQADPEYCRHSASFLEVLRWWWRR